MSTLLLSRPSAGVLLQRCTVATTIAARVRRFATTSSAPSSSSLMVLYDGSCPLCIKEIALLRRLKRANELHWVDIAQRGWDPKTALGRDEVEVPPVDTLLSEMHVYDPGRKRFHTRMEAFRQMYAALGLGWVWAWTAYWPFRPVADHAYMAFARNRHWLAARLG